jgi:hypothetical protein
LEEPLKLAAIVFASLMPVFGSITFSNGGTGPAVPDATPAGVNSDIFVATPSLTIQSLSLQLSGFSHTFAGDLIFTLEHVGVSGGGPFFVLNRQGGACNFLVGNTYDFAAGGAVFPTSCSGSGGNLPSGTYAPFEPISSNFNGQSTSGTWRLHVSDNAGIDTSNSGWTWTFTVTDASIPEPATFFPVALVLGGLGLRAFRRRT